MVKGMLSRNGHSNGVILMNVTDPLTVGRYIPDQATVFSPVLYAHVSLMGLKTFSQPPWEYFQPKDSTTRVRSVP